MAARPRPLLAPDGLDALRTAITGYTVAGVHELLGPAGQAAHDRGDLAGVARTVRAATGSAADADTRRVGALVRLFLLGGIFFVETNDARFSRRERGVRRER